MPSDAAFDPALLARYDRPAPRYTAYPTATQFSTGFGEADLREAIRAGNGDPIPRPLSLYVHVPYCSSPCFYCGCNRTITRDRARIARYLAPLGAEIDLVAPLFARDREVRQLHFGGGTPNLLAPAQLGAIVGHLREDFRFADDPDLEVAIEVDPRACRPGDVAGLAAIGVNRISLGVQDFDPGVQAAVNRVQSIRETLVVLEAARRHGMRSVNIDLIYGLPRQTPEGFARTLDIVAAARPDRVAVYAYAHMPMLFHAQRRIVDAELPPPDARLALLGLAVERLGAAGYRHIGMDHFALPEDPLAVARDDGRLRRDFMGYTTQAECDLVGLGVSAISRIGDTMSQNPRDQTAWEAALAEGRLPAWRGLRMDEDDLVRADVIQDVMCRGRVEYAAIERRHGIAFRRHFATALQRLRLLAEDGLVRLAPGGFEVTPRGRWLLRNVAACFDRYLPDAMPAAHAAQARLRRRRRARGAAAPPGPAPAPGARAPR